MDAWNVPQRHLLMKLIILPYTCILFSRTSSDWIELDPLISPFNKEQQLAFMFPSACMLVRFKLGHDRCDVLWNISNIYNYDHQSYIYGSQKLNIAFLISELIPILDVRIARNGYHLTCNEYYFYHKNLEVSCALAWSCLSQSTIIVCHV